MKKQQLLFTILFVILVTSFIIFNIFFISDNCSSTLYISYIDSFGYESIITSTPETIISLSPNTTEILCCLGLEDKIIGRTDYCDYPPSISDITSIGSITEPNLEVIVDLNPDIIITDGMQSKAIIDSIRNLGYTVIITRNNESISGTYDIISDIGLVTNTSENAIKVIDNMKTEISKITDAVSKIETKKSVYYSISLSEYGLYTAGSNTYINDLLNLAGFINIAADTDGWSYSIENLINNNPDYIICSNLYNSKNTILNFSYISSLDAIQNSNIIEIDVNLLERQGPRNIDGLKILLNKIYNINI